MTQTRHRAATKLPIEGIKAVHELLGAGVRYGIIGGWGKQVKLLAAARWFQTVEHHASFHVAAAGFIEFFEQAATVGQQTEGIRGRAAGQGDPNGTGVERRDDSIVAVLAEEDGEQVSLVTLGAELLGGTVEIGAGSAPEVVEEGEALAEACGSS